MKTITGGCTGPHTRTCPTLADLHLWPHHHRHLLGITPPIGVILAALVQAWAAMMAGIPPWARAAVMTCTGAALEEATMVEKAGTKDSAIIQVWGRKIISWTLPLEEEEEAKEKRKRRNKEHRRPLNPGNVVL
ncbi:unnamed protein product [Cuscuta epithymum]|uniref:Uncharacterized protein n=1 Tax=Cuscuta epithymum TaxID=186058 RepID=A0AAV0CV04_9ASTE|nr:unnamed protein product [Cuscuta epithymum]CAH9133102.1 unnamed protein product [Cuscuta epithymum]